MDIYNEHISLTHG